MSKIGSSRRSDLKSAPASRENGKVRRYVYDLKNINTQLVESLVEDITKFLQKELGVEGWSIRIESAKAIVSLSGQVLQDVHQDSFITKFLNHKFSMLANISDRPGRLVVYPGSHRMGVDEFQAALEEGKLRACVVELRKDEAFFFHRSLWHAGFFYSEEHVRLFMYIDIVPLDVSIKGNQCTPLLKKELGRQSQKRKIFADARDDDDEDVFKFAGDSEFNSIFGLKPVIPWPVKVYHYNGKMHQMYCEDRFLQKDGSLLTSTELCRAPRLSPTKTINSNVIEEKKKKKKKKKKRSTCHHY